MEKIFELLQNQWVVAIGSSVISGVIVFLVTEKFFKHSQNKENAKKIENANLEIISILTRCIVDGDLLKPEVAIAVQKSSCRRYGINENEVFSLEEIGEELLNDILKTPYISVKQKEEYAEKMIRYKLEVKSVKLDKTEKSSTHKENNDYKEYSALIGIITSIIPLIAMFIILGNYNITNYEIFLSIISMELIILLIIISFIYKKMLEKRRKKYREQLMRIEMIENISKNLKK